MISRFICEQLNDTGTHDDPDHTCPRFTGRLQVFNHATATFHTPSDPSNVDGLRQEVVRAAPLWRGEASRYDCIFVNQDDELDGMRGLEVARAICFFSFIYLGISYACTLLQWFSRIAEEIDEVTGMWMVAPDFNLTGSPVLAVVHVDCILRAAHLIPIFGDSFVSDDITHTNSLDRFKGFYVNRFIDHHAFNIML